MSNEEPLSLLRLDRYEMNVNLYQQLTGKKAYLTDNQ